MKNRHLFLVVGLVASLTVGFIAFLVATDPRPRLTDENIARIQPGMTLAEVEAIVGAPPGDYGRGWVSVRRSGLCGEQCYDWMTDTKALRITVDDDGKVTWAGDESGGLYRLLHENPLIDRIRRWLHL